MDTPAEKVLEDIRGEIDRISRPLSRADYRELLSLLATEVQCRQAALEDDEANDDE